MAISQITHTPIQVTVPTFNLAQELRAGHSEAQHQDDEYSEATGEPYTLITMADYIQTLTPEEMRSMLLAHVTP